LHDLHPKNEYQNLKTELTGAGRKAKLRGPTSGHSAVHPVDFAANCPQEWQAI